MMMSQSMYSQRNSSERESGPGHRATSVHGLDKSGTEEGESDLMTQSYHPSSSAHRRRTDLMPTITYNTASPGTGISRASTPGTRMLRSPGKAQSMSRLDALSKPRLKHAATPLSLAPKRPVPKTTSPPTTSGYRKMSQSMTHLAHLSPVKKSGSRVKGKLKPRSKTY
jgi:hypothetical protein